MFIGCACWCWRQDKWDEFGEGRMEETVFVIHRGKGHRGKSDHSRFPSTELGMRPVGLDLRSTRRGVGLPLSTCCPGLSAPWFSRLCMLELGFGTQKQVGRGRLGRDGLWDPQEIPWGRQWK